MSFSLGPAIWHFLMQPGDKLDGDQYWGLPLTGPGLPVLLIDVAYLGFVLYVGPKFMAHRKPYSLRLTLIVYNTLQIVCNAFLLFASISVVSLRSPNHFSCMTKRSPDDPLKAHEVFLTYGYYLLKFVDYLDTVFFVLRKSYKQVTVLHVYHHMMMSTIVYLHLRYYGYGGNGQMVGIVNAAVHTVMYTYYLWSSLRPALWWKKYITLIQLGQFVFLVVHQSGPLLYAHDCVYPRVWSLLSALNGIVMIVLFGRFYYRSYMRPAQRAKAD